MTRNGNAAPLADSPGSICIPTTEMQRFLLFTISLAGTNQPPNCYLNATASGSVTENLNNCFRQLRTQGEPVAGGDPNVPAVVTDRWAWIMGDDHCWKNETLVDMLLTMDAHPEIDVLVPLVTKRNPPWHLVLFHDRDEQDSHGHPMFDVMGWDEIPTTGVFPVDAAGSAGMLIRREVIDHIGDPWFYNTVDKHGRGVVLNEDVTFCRRLRDEGFSLYATADCALGHLGIFNVRPMHNGERWGALTEFATMEDRFRHVFMPVEEPASV